MPRKRPEQTEAQRTRQRQEFFSKLPRPPQTVSASILSAIRQKKGKRKASAKAEAKNRMRWGKLAFRRRILVNFDVEFRAAGLACETWNLHSVEAHFKPVRRRGESLAHLAPLDGFLRLDKGRKAIRLNKVQKGFVGRAGSGLSCWKDKLFLLWRPASTATDKGDRFLFRSFQFLADIVCQQGRKETLLQMRKNSMLIIKNC